MKTVQYKVIIILVVIAATIISCINPEFPHDMFLQHIGTLLLLLILVNDLKKNTLSSYAFICVAVYAILHIIGARWVYSYVPYNDWSKAIFSWDINEYFHTSRNHYDRFIHLVFGILAFPYIFELVSKWGNISRAKVILTTWLFIQTASMLYELFEWGLTFLVSAEMADNYNGQQGDMWDAQKDMALATLSSTIAALLMLLKKRKQD